MNSILTGVLFFLCLPMLTQSIEVKANFSNFLKLSKKLGDDNDTYPCAQLYKRSDPCQYVKEHCDKTYIPYLELYFCQFNRNAGFYPIFGVWLLILLYLLGDTADEYFCDTLESLTEISRMPANVAGVTFLAFGNGSPDVFSAIAAFSSQSGSDIGFGALIGAGIFVTTVVVAAVAFVSPSRLHRWPFIRDVLCYMAAVIFLGGIFFDGRVTLVEAIGFVALYISYVIVVLGAQYFTSAMEAHPELRSGTIASYHRSVAEKSRSGGVGGYTRDYANSYLEVSDDEKEDDAVNDHLRIPTASALDFASVTSANIERAHLHHRPKRKISSGLKWYEAGHVVRNQNNNIHQLQYAAEIKTSLVDKHKQSNNSTFNTPPPMQWSRTGNVSPLNSKNNSQAASRQLSPKRGDAVSGSASPIRRITEFVIEEEKWENMGKVDKLIMFIMLPFIIARSITIPLVEEESWNKYKVMACALFSMPVGFFVVGIHNIMLGPLPLWSIGFIIGFIFLIMVGKWTKNDELPKKRFPFAFSGFVMSIIWIYVIANELVSLLEAFGHLLHIPKVVLGFTILAWGNSIGDLAADVAIARKGKVSMAIAGTFAGPMFNLLIGLGIALLFNTVQNYPNSYILKSKIDVPISMGYLLLSLLGSFVIVTSSNYTLTKKYALFLVGLYLLFLITTAVLTLGLIPDPKI